MTLSDLPHLRLVRLSEDQAADLAEPDGGPNQVQAGAQQNEGIQR
jgi:hypothetical protein